MSLKKITDKLISNFFSCVITNCILCNGSTIEEGSELKDCIVGAQHTVSAGSRHSHEVLTDFANLMEI